MTRLQAPFLKAPENRTVKNVIISCFLRSLLGRDVKKKTEEGEGEGVGVGGKPRKRDCGWLVGWLVADSA